MIPTWLSDVTYSGIIEQSLKSEQNSSLALFCLHSVVLTCLPPTNGHRTKAKTPTPGIFLPNSVQL